MAEGEPNDACLTGMEVDTVKGRRKGGTDRQTDRQTDRHTDRVLRMLCQLL